MSQMLKNNFVKPKNGINYSRSLFPYEKRHTTNLLAGAIVPVHCQFLLPGMSPDWNFGCSIESAPLISTNFDNVYVDVVSIWCPIRLVMTDFNEWLGESNTVAFTLNRSITIPKLGYVNNENWIQTGSSGTTSTAMSRAFLADHFLGVHFGFRYHGIFDITDNTKVQANSQFAKGISVIPSRIYELNWNTYFRNENVQTPILIDKTSAIGSHDTAAYTNGLGRIQFANRLKNFYTVATPAPSLLDVSIALDQFLAPVGIFATANGTSPGSIGDVLVKTGDTFTNGSFIQSTGNQYSGSNVSGITGNPVIADLSALTVNRMYYALMLQRFANKMMKGRRAVEFYENFFGIENSEAGHDLPQMLIHKRFPLNITQIIATAAGTDGFNKTDLGQKGAYSVTGFGGSLCKNFVASEHGYIQTYLIIRPQPSLAAGIDKHLGYDSVLDTYITTFDHIGPVGIETLEVNEQVYTPGIDELNFGFTNAWYQDRKQVNDVVGICEPGQPLEYKTLADSFFSSPIVISDSFLRVSPAVLDRLFLYPVHLSGMAGAVGYDEFGINANTDRYQFICQFVVKGQTAAVMSPDSEPLQLRI